MIETDARAAHSDLFYRYAMAIDHRDWPAFAALFTADAEFFAQVGREGEPPRQVAMDCHDRDELVAAISATIETCDGTHHMVGNEHVDLAADWSSGRASCHFRAYHAGSGSRAGLFEESLGRFVIHTVREGGAWKIRRMEEYIMVMLGTAHAFGG